MNFSSIFFESKLSFEEIKDEPSIEWESVSDFVEYSSICKSEGVS